MPNLIEIRDSGDTLLIREGAVIDVMEGANLKVSGTKLVGTLAGLSDVDLTGVQAGDGFMWDGSKLVKRSPAVISVDVQIAHAAILTLPSTSVLVVPAPGVGKAVQFLGGWLVADVTAGPYSGMSTGGTSPFSGNPGSLYLTHGSTDDQNVSQPVQSAAMLGNLAVNYADFGLLTAWHPESTAWPLQAPYVVDVGIVEEAIYLYAANADGNFADGNAANTLSLRVWYRIVPTVPFGG